MFCLQNLKLGQRHILGLSMMALAMALILVGGYFLAQTAVHRLARIHGQISAKTVAGVELADAYSKDLVALVDKLNSGAYPWQVGLKRLDEIQTEIDSNMGIMGSPPLDADEVQLLQDIQNSDDAVDFFIYQLKSILQKRDRQALKQFSRRLYPTVDPLGFRISHFLEYELERSRVLMDANQNSLNHRYGVMVTLDLAFILFVFGLVSSHLRRTVSKPLALLADRMKHIAQGDADLSKRLEVQGHDEIGEVEVSFNTFVSKLQSVEEMKMDLIAVTSHQLKTPVAEINGYIDNILMGLVGEMNPRQKEYLQDMRQIGQENYNLICNLLNASKIERGVVMVDLKPVGICEVVSAALRDYEAALEQKGLELRMEGLGDETMVFADRDKMVEVLRNLLNNAVKCTQKGSITLRARRRGNWGTLEVSDTGVGMDDETLGRLFTKNRILGHEAHRSGAGLGLYISKNFMKLQHGDIRVASHPGKGTRFTLLVPQFAQTQ